MTAPLNFSVDRIPPNDLAAEMAVLGGVMVEREMMATAAAMLEPTDFYAPLHVALYEVMRSLYDRGEPIDKVMVGSALRDAGMLDKIGGMAYLSSLMDAVPTSASIASYARVVKEKSRLRALIHAGGIVTRAGFDGEGDVDAAVEEAERALTDAVRDGASDAFVSAEHAVAEVFGLIGNYRRNGMTTGFVEIDDYTHGWQPGQFVVIAARPGMGKTSFGMQTAVAGAKATQRPIAVFSLEMPKAELMLRMLCTEARVDAQALKADQIEPDVWARLSWGMGAVSDIPVFIDDTAGVEPSTIRARARRLQSQHGLGAIVVDYIQLVRCSDRKNGSRNDELTEICRTLKETAKELNVPVIGLAQLNRQVEQRQDKRPMLSDLRESGAIEQEADIVSFLYREGYYDPECEDPQRTEFIIAKHRGGKMGTVPLRFIGEHTMFVPHADEERYSR